MSGIAPPDSDDFTVVYTVTMIGEIRRTHNQILNRTGYMVIDARTGKQYHVSRSSQAERCIRYFGGRLCHKELLITSFRNEHGNMQVEHIDVT